MISRTTPLGFEIGNQDLQMFPMVTEDLMPLPNSMEGISSSTSPSNSLLFNLSIVKDKLNQVQTLVGVILSPNQQDPSTSMALSTMNSTIQEIIVTSTSMMFTCQQIALSFPQGTTSIKCTNQEFQKQQSNIQSNFGNNDTSIDLRGQSIFSNNESEPLDWFGESYNSNINYRLKDDIDDQRVDHDISETNNSIRGSNEDISTKNNNSDRDDTCLKFGSSYNWVGPECDNEIVELDATDLLAKYTHYCQVCGKGFKRDANLRMHMRAHGDEYKSSAALSNPINKNRDYLMSMKNKKYSCPQEGCRWNQKHVKFQPLKSLICAKNHYKRSHCPKMYVCKRCNLKQFSVLSDLRTHEKHCGDLRWQCSCGTTFSRKDKLMGHVGLFVGHRPVINGLSYSTHTS